MGSPIPGSMEMPDVPEHFLMTVDAQGRGPADKGETADIVCWCGTPGCLKFLGSWKDAQAAFWAALEALKTQSHEAVTPQFLEAWGMGELSEGEHIGVIQCGDTDPHGIHLWHGYYRLCRGCAFPGTSATSGGSAMPEHKIRVRRYRGIRAETSLRAQDYPPEHLVSWWMTCRAIECPVNRGTWAYSWEAAVTWAICHRVDPDWKPGDVLPVRDIR